METNLLCELAVRDPAALGYCVVGWTRHNTDENGIDGELVTVITTTIVCPYRVRATSTASFATTYSISCYYKLL